MATLSKHGEVIVRIPKMRAEIAYMTDGHVLRRAWGGGWKQWRRVKPELSPHEVALQAAVRHEEFLRNNPAFAAFKHELFAMFPPRQRPLVEEAIRSLGDDVDGITYELKDAGCDVTLDEMIHLMELMDEAVSELKARRAGKAVSYDD